MKTLPPIGSRARYTRKPTKYLSSPRTVTGTVIQLFPAHSWIDDETGEHLYEPPHASVRVDTIPDWWAYTGCDVFAPSIHELEPIK